MGVPPATVTLTLPVEPPLQLLFVGAPIVAVAPLELVMVTEEVVVQPPASVTVTVYVPAAKLLTVADVGPVSHL